MARAVPRIRLALLGSVLAALPWPSAWSVAAADEVVAQVGGPNTRNEFV